jgi:oligosaccharide repeat unit polymerase
LNLDILDKPVIPSFVTVKEAAIINLVNTQSEDVLFVVSILGLAIFSFFIFKRIFLGNSLKLSRLTLPSFFICAYIILMSLPSVIWFYGTNQPIRYTYFLAVQSVLISFPLGVLLANVLFIDLSKPSRIVKGFLYSSLSKTRHDLYIFPFWILMFCLSILIAAFYILTSNYVPLIGALTAYGKMPGELVRPSIYWAGDFIHYAHALAARFFLPFCLLYSYFMAYIYKGVWKYLFWITLLLVMFIFLLTFDRSYPLSVFLFLAFAVYFKIKNIQLISMNSFPSTPKIHTASTAKARLAISIFVIFVLAMVAGGIISITQYNRPLNLIAIWKTSINFIDRVLLDASFMAFVYFEQFNNPSTFLYGKSIHVILSSLFGVEFHPTVSPSFVAELWLNFGWFGVLLGTTIIGFILQFIQLRLFRKKSIPTLSFYIILLLNGAWIIYGHVLATMVVSVYLLGILFLIFLKRTRLYCPLS